MDEKELIKIIEETLKEKTKENEKILKYSFYELRVKHNLTEKETDRFLELIKNKLEKDNYSVYFTGAKFTFEKAGRIVQPNELMIAIKNII